MSQSPAIFLAPGADSGNLGGEEIIALTDTSHIVGGGPKKVLYTLATINRIGVGKAAKVREKREF